MRASITEKLPVKVWRLKYNSAIIATLIFGLILGSNMSSDKVTPVHVMATLLAATGFSAVVSYVRDELSKNIEEE